VSEALLDAATAHTSFVRATKRVIRLLRLSM